MGYTKGDITVGDTVTGNVTLTVVGKVEYVGPISGTVTVRDGDGRQYAILRSNVTHVKKAPPPEPPVGTIITHHNIYRWVRQPDGWRSLRSDGTIVVDKGGAKWEEFSHEAAKVVSKPPTVTF